MRFGWRAIKKVDKIQRGKGIETMKLTKRQQEIVKKISKGEITDILSFVKSFNLGEENCFDKTEVVDRFEAVYSDKKFLCDTVHFDNYNQLDRIIERIDKKTGYCRANLSFQNSYSNFSCAGVNYSYHIFKPVYTSSAMDEIISFIALWQYLQSQALIIELPKTCSEEDMGLFLKCKQSNAKSSVTLSDDNTAPYAYYNLDVSFYDFFDGEYALDKENFEICFPYLNRKIYPAPELKTFIQKGYKTNEEINNCRNLWIALVGVIIAIITSVGSMYMSALDRGYYTEFMEINSSLKEIEDAIQDIDSDEEAELKKINNILQDVQKYLLEKGEQSTESSP